MKRPLKSPDSANTTAVQFTAGNLFPIKEVLDPCVFIIAIGGTPEVRVQNTANSIFIQLKLMQLLLVRQKPVTVTIHKSIGGNVGIIPVQNTFFLAIRVACRIRFGNN